MTTTKPTMARLRRMAAKVGATIDVGTSGLSWSLYIDSPPGMIFRGTGSHGVAESCLASDTAERRRCIERACEIMSEGMESGCEISDPSECDICAG